MVLTYLRNDLQGQTDGSADKAFTVPENLSLDPQNPWIARCGHVYLYFPVLLQRDGRQEDSQKFWGLQVWHRKWGTIKHPVSNKVEAETNTKLSSGLQTHIVAGTYLYSPIPHIHTHTHEL